MIFIKSLGRIFSFFIVLCLFTGMINAVPSLSTQHSLAEPIIPPHQITSPLFPQSDILQMIQRVNTTQLDSYLQKIQSIGPHPTGSTAIDRFATYLYDTLVSFGLSVGYDHWSYKLRRGDNIEATLEGTENPNGIIIVCAHYDSVKQSPGVNDDGSGVAALLSAAEILSRYSFNSTIKFVLFSGEEQGLLGSHQYAHHAAQHHENIIGVLNLDGLGYAATTEDGTKIKHLANNQSAWMVDISQTIASTYPEVIGLEIIRLPHVAFSDHDSFVTYHFDASYLWQYTSSPYYHTQEDTLEHVNITYLTKICRLTIGILATMAALTPLLTDNDLPITIQGSTLAHPNQFIIRIQNKKATNDTANVTIHVTLKDLRTGNYVLINNLTHNNTCNWTFIEEITTEWIYYTKDNQYTNQVVSLEVTIKGTKDDVTVYKTQHTKGIILAQSFYLIPK